MPGTALTSSWLMIGHSIQPITFVAERENVPGANSAYKRNCTMKKKKNVGFPHRISASLLGMVVCMFCVLPVLCILFCCLNFLFPTSHHNTHTNTHTYTHTRIHRQKGKREERERGEREKTQIICKILIKSDVEMIQ